MERNPIHFSKKELRCRCAKCNGNVPHEITEEAMDFLVMVRAQLGESMNISSAYRCAEHPIEAKKARAGTHNRGAFDVLSPNGAYAFRLAKIALANGATGIGFSLANKDRSKRFVHIDYDTTRTTPVMWSY